jgi:hypothetical protein
MRSRRSRDKKSPRTAVALTIHVCHQKALPSRAATDSRLSQPRIVVSRTTLDQSRSSESLEHPGMRWSSGLIRPVFAGGIRRNSTRGRRGDGSQSCCLPEGDSTWPGSITFPCQVTTRFPDPLDLGVSHNHALLSNRPSGSLRFRLSQVAVLDLEKDRGPCSQLTSS